MESPNGVRRAFANKLEPFVAETDISWWFLVGHCMVDTNLPKVYCCWCLCKELSKKRARSKPLLVQLIEYEKEQYDTESIHFEVSREDNKITSQYCHLQP